MREVAVKANARDKLVLFIAGHGVSPRKIRKDYYFLTSEAAAFEFNDASLNQVSLSGRDLEQLSLEIPTARRVLILDTCAAGNFIEQLKSGERGDSDEIDKGNEEMWDRMRDRTGYWVLAGSAANENSYGDPHTGLGNLTYSLLEALKNDFDTVLLPNPKSGRKELVDVNRLFNYAVDKVEKLTGRRQQPVLLARNDWRSFPIGRILEEDRPSLPSILPKVVFVQSALERAGDIPEDPLNLSGIMNELLFSSSIDMDSQFILRNSSSEINAFRITGRYDIKETQVEVKVYLKVFDKQGQSLETRIVGEPIRVVGEKGKLDELANSILQKVIERAELTKKPSQ